MGKLKYSTLIALQAYTKLVPCWKKMMTFWWLQKWWKSSNAAHESFGADYQRVYAFHPNLIDRKPFIVLADRFSSFIWADRIKDETTESVITYLENIFYDYGFPKELRSDGGPCFRQRFTGWCGQNYLHHEKSSAYHPELNGLSGISVKQANRLIIKAKRMWQNMKEAIFQLRNTVLRGVGAPPSELFFKRKTKNPLPNLPKKIDLGEAVRKKDTKGRKKKHRVKNMRLANMY